MCVWLNLKLVMIPKQIFACTTKGLAFFQIKRQLLTIRNLGMGEKCLQAHLPAACCVISGHPFSLVQGNHFWNKADFAQMPVIMFSWIYSRKLGLPLPVYVSGPCLLRSLCHSATLLLAHPWHSPYWTPLTSFCQASWPISGKVFLPSRGSHWK